MRLDPNIWPPGGWQYEELCTGCKFRGKTLDELAEKVREHREANALGREDKVVEDIEEQILLRAPEGWG